MTKQLLGLTLAAAWLGTTSAWAQAPATVTAPAATAAPAATPTPDAPAPRRNAPVQGTVSAMDAAKKTLTITPRRGGTDTTLTLAPDAKILVTQTAAVGDIKTGNLVQAYGDLTPGATSVTATRLEIVPSDTPTGKPGPTAGYHRTYVLGTVANTSPALTMTTAGGVTVTVTTSADTRVTKVVPGTVSDLVVGANVQARTSGDAASPTATEVRVLPARAARQGRRRNAAPGAATATAPAATTAPTATP